MSHQQLHFAGLVLDLKGNLKEDVYSCYDNFINETTKLCKVKETGPEWSLYAYVRFDPMTPDDHGFYEEYDPKNASDRNNFIPNQFYDDNVLASFRDRISITRCLNSLESKLKHTVEKEEAPESTAKYCFLRKYRLDLDELHEAYILPEKGEMEMISHGDQIRFNATSPQPDTETNSTAVESSTASPDTDATRGVFTAENSTDSTSDTLTTLESNALEATTAEDAIETLLNGNSTDLEMSLNGTSTANTTEPGSAQHSIISKFLIATSLLIVQLN
ncbi:hypothetical protein L596_013381 [Steinernema carpocapsae]|uniref:Uncharacterized protein n=1 Tax=Steinernema carpocapsae TaxID=34508 RepID=A0A4V6A532_STECR|nr:hypothetical protein L596_013381 [Steinernema carpocapsae]